MLGHEAAPVKSDSKLVHSSVSVVPDEKESIEAIRRLIPKYSGLYIDGMVEDVNVLPKDEHGPAYLKKMVFRGTEVPIHFIQLRSEVDILVGRKVMAREDVHIPGMSEVLVEVIVEHCKPGGEDDLCIILEPDPRLAERSSLVIASSIMVGSGNMASTVRVMNPFEETAMVHRGMVLGTAEGVDVLAELTNEDRDNTVPVESIRTCKEPAEGQRKSAWNLANIYGKN